MDEFQTIGRNVEAAIADEGKTLVLRVDLTEPGQPSSSGKSMVIASTHGFTSVNGVGVSLNVTRRKERRW